MQNWKKSLSLKTLTVGVGIGFTLTSAQPRPAQAIVGLSVTGGAAGILIAAGALTLGVTTPLAVPGGVLTLLACGSHNNSSCAGWAAGETTLGMLAIVGVILLDQENPRIEFSPPTANTLNQLAQILPPAQVAAYSQEYEEIQLVHQEVQRDVESAAHEASFNAETLFRFSGERWFAHGQAALSFDAQQAVAKIAAELARQ